MTRLFSALSSLVLAAGLLVVAAPLTSASVTASLPAPAASAKVKCVKTSTGFARYSTTGTCGRGERRDRRSCALGGSCVVGDTGPGGGKIFYSARTAQPWGRYLEVAPASWNPPDGDLNVIWCPNVTDSIPGTQATGLGSGKANTAAMLAACPAEAAVVVSSYRGGGKSDWYLPSRDELRQLFLHKKVSSGFQLHGYWSSSEDSPTTAWIQDFYADYTPAPSDKSYASFVRPIRAF